MWVEVLIASVISAILITGSGVVWYTAEQRSVEAQNILEQIKKDRYACFKDFKCGSQSRDHVY
jgi:Tfp pilus assembly protein PilW